MDATPVWGSMGLDEDDFVRRFEACDTRMVCSGMQITYVWRGFTLDAAVSPRLNAAWT